MRKITKITYNPYVSRISFKISSGVSEPLTDLGDNSALLYYQNSRDVFFPNCAEDIVHEIYEKQNSTTDGLEIQFVGTDSDFEILHSCVETVDNGSKGKLSCRQVGRFKSADQVLEIIKADYKQIAQEFHDYKNGEIGKRIARFERTISDQVPVCVMGMYSTGKSAFINALIGDEILPSKVNASTAKNVRVESDFLGRYSICFVYKDTKMSVDVCDGHLEPTNLDKLAAGACKELSSRIDLMGKTAARIMHDILDLLNEVPDDDFLKSFGWNVSIKVPFKNPMLSKEDGRIVFYDTPGSNNGQINQEAHKDALNEFLSGQTNAYPILLTKKDEITAHDNVSTTDLLDQHRANFSNANALVVISQCDRYTQDELYQEIPDMIKRWHGGSTILFATSVGAIGERKKDDSKWIDASYEQVFERWKMQQENPKTRVCLPKLNHYPCQGRDIIDVKNQVSKELYDTGIPCVEAEILYHVEHYANYMKDYRGRMDLRDALTYVSDLLRNQKDQITQQRKQARQIKYERRQKLIEELKAIELGDLLEKEC